MPPSGIKDTDRLALTSEKEKGLDAATSRPQKETDVTNHMIAPTGPNMQTLTPALEQIRRSVDRFPDSDVVSLLQADWDRLLSDLEMTARHVESHRDDLSPAMYQRTIDGLLTVIATLRELECESCQGGKHDRMALVAYGHQAVCPTCHARLTAADEVTR